MDARGIAMAAVLTCSVLLLPGVAAGDCAAEPVQGVLEAPVALVGRVTEVRGSVARVAVSTVINGPDVAPEVWVQGALTGEPLSRLLGSSSSVDLQWVGGASYAIGANDRFETNQCRATEDIDAVLAAVPAADQRTPVPGGHGGYPLRGISFASIAVGIAALGVVGVGVVLWATRRRSPRPAGPHDPPGDTRTIHP